MRNESARFGKQLRARGAFPARRCRDDGSGEMLARAELVSAMRIIARQPAMAMGLPYRQAMNVCSLYAYFL